MIKGIDRISRIKRGIKNHEHLANPFNLVHRQLYFFFDLNLALTE